MVIELKRDDSGTDVHWQAIKYASYLQRASTSDIVKLAAEHHSCAPEEAELMLLQHLGTDDLNALNHDQRIILASHRFAPEVTSAALWLNRKAPGEDLITCVALTPYRDAMTGTLYVQASTLIPVARDRRLPDYHWRKRATGQGCHARHVGSEAAGDLLPEHQR